MFKKYVQRRLERYVKKYFKRHHPTLIAVVGSVGKTSTKTAIATALSSKYRIQMEPSNHNSPLSVPLAIMGVKYPPEELVHDMGTWFKVFKAMKQRIKAPQGVDIIIQELATDKPGDLAVFARYLRPDITVVTAITPEHMVNFPGGLGEVAREELSLGAFSKALVYGSDDIDEEFLTLAGNNNITSYGIDTGNYRLQINGGSPLAGYMATLTPLRGQPLNVKLNVVGNQSLKTIVAAYAVAHGLGVSDKELAQTLPLISPVNGRMNPLEGRNKSIIIDDSYNSSPAAAIAALKTLYQIESPCRIAVLGSMNELGKFSVMGHSRVGEYCDPTLLDWVITIGEEANNILAGVAKKRGCQVRSFKNPLEAGAFINHLLIPGAVVLVKGSQNGVFTEEIVRVLLAHGEDRAKLVRQTPYWKDVKQTWMLSLGGEQKIANLEKE